MSEEYLQGMLAGLVTAQSICQARATKCDQSAERETHEDLRDAYKDAAWVYWLAADYIHQEWERVANADR